MSRYLGPIWKKSRSLSFPFLGGKEFAKGKKRTTPPGIHGSKPPKRQSVYYLQNKEKQKLRYLYGIREKQLYNLFKKLKEFNTKDLEYTIIKELETRVDNIIFRSGLAPTRRFARQIVAHGHLLLNNKKIKTPSIKINPGQVLTFKKEKLFNNKIIKDHLKTKPTPCLFSILNMEQKNITLVRNPDKTDLEIKHIEKNIKIPLIVAWYNRKI